MPHVAAIGSNSHESSAGSDLLDLAHQHFCLADRCIINELAIERNRTSAELGGLIHGLDRPRQAVVRVPAKASYEEESEESDEASGEEAFPPQSQTFTCYATVTDTAGSKREVEEFRIHPNTIKELPTGQAALITKTPRAEACIVQVIPGPRDGTSDGS